MYYNFREANFLQKIEIAIFEGDYFDKLPSYVLRNTKKYFWFEIIALKNVDSHWNLRINKKSIKLKCLWQFSFENSRKPNQDSLCQNLLFQYINGDFENLIRSIIAIIKLLINKSLMH